MKAVGGAAAAEAPERRAAVGRTALDDEAWRDLHAAAAAPYRRAGRFSWHWARGKLGRDPVFRSLIEGGRLPASARVVDIGCGQGLLASLLQAATDMAARGDWPAAWPPPPSATAYTGIDLSAREIARGQAALGGLPLASSLLCADMRSAALPACNVVVILDVLHYVDPVAQLDVLQRVVAALAESAEVGRLLLRVGDAASSRGFAISQWVDRVVTGFRGHRTAPTFGRPLDEWVALLEGLGFAVESQPMSRGTPFANVLLVCDLNPPGRPA